MQKTHAHKKSPKEVFSLGDFLLSRRDYYFNESSIVCTDSANLGSVSIKPSTARHA